MKTPRVTFNLVEHPNQKLCKTLRVDAQGNLLKSPGARIPAGSCVTTCHMSLSEYVEYIYESGTRKYALSANVELGKETELTVKELAGSGKVDRSAQTMVYVQGPAIVTLDHDPSANGLQLNSPTDLWSVLCDQFPNTFSADVARGGYYSSGSFIYGADGKQLTGAKGHHTVLAVEDATDITRFRDALFQRLWLVGYGHIFITADGKMLPRTIFDAKVLEPQQPIFGGGANCLDGLTQKRPAPEIHDGGYLDTTSLKSLISSEVEEFNRLVEAAKVARKAEAEKIRRDYQKREVERLVEGGMSVPRARNTVEARMGGTLVGEDLLQFGEQGSVTVATVLADPASFDECSLHDPLEPDYGGATTAMFFSNEENGVPVVFSHAHGGRTFLLRHDEQSLIARLQTLSVDELNYAWPRLLMKGELRQDAQERVLKAIKDRNGVALKALRSALKEAIRETVNRSHEIPDAGLALANRTLERFYHGGDWLIRTQDGSFWRYTGTHWEVVTDKILSAEIQRVAIDEWDDLLAIYMGQGHQSAPTLASMVNNAMVNLGNLVTQPGDPLRLKSPRQSVINVLNGELWLGDNGPRLRPHSPESYLTSCADFAYDETAKAPTYEEALRGMLSEPGGAPFVDQAEMYRHVNELLGYICQPRRWLKVFCLIVGPGDNGKTQLAKLLERVIGISAISFGRLSGVKEDGGPFSAAKLVGKLAHIDDDADRDYLLPDGFLKKISEEKPMTGERKFKDEFQFVAQVVVLILANSWPRTKDLSRGMRTRAQVLKLPRSFHKPSETSSDDPDIQRPELWAKVFADELPGVLNLWIDGFYRVLRRGGFLPPLSAVAAYDEWWSEANVVTRFINEVCMRLDRNKPGCTTLVLHEVLTFWARENKVPEKYWPSLNSLKSKLQELGYDVAHGNKGSTIRGLRVPNSWLKKAVSSWQCSRNDLLKAAVWPDERDYMSAADLAREDDAEEVESENPFDEYDGGSAAPEAERVDLESVEREVGALVAHLNSRD